MSFAESRLQVDTKSIEEFAQKMHTDIFRRALEMGANRIMGEWYRRVVELSPVADVDGGTLQDSWEVGEARWDGNAIVIDIYNTAVGEDGAPYPIYVEFGHRQNVGQFVPAIGKTLVRAWIPGQAFFRDSRDETEEIAGKILEEVVREVWNSL